MDADEDSPLARAIAHVAKLSAGPPLDPTFRVTINFHPDRAYKGLPLLEVMAREGVYRSQFETGTSNGGLTAHRGGARWRWESRIFGGAYDEAEAPARPKYGALNFRRKAIGGSARFGSAHLRLKADVLERVTFCYPDSVFDPDHFGVASQMSLVGVAEAHIKDALDDYIEAQVHGSLDFARDVEALVLDPCFRDSDIALAAEKLPCTIEWHAGFNLDVADLRSNPDYRGSEYVALGVALAKDGKVTPRMIGDAARTGEHDEQALKRVWHYVARFGAP